VITTLKEDLSILFSTFAPHLTGRGLVSDNNTQRGFINPLFDLRPAPDGAGLGE